MELQKVDSYNNEQKKKLILQKFYDNVKMQFQVKKLFFKLSNHGNAAVFSLFDKWKMLPDVKAKQQESLMNKCVGDLERKLSDLVMRNMKKTFTPLRDDLLEGQAKQRGAINALLQTQQSDVEKSFKKWKYDIAIEKVVNKVK